MISFLKAHDLGGYIDDYEMSSRTGMGKGQNVRLLMERNEIEMKDAVYVGDTHGDETAAREAAIAFIHAAYGFGNAEHPDGIAKKLTDLPDLIDRML